jgi:hypothetical protein
MRSEYAMSDFSDMRTHHLARSDASHGPGRRFRVLFWSLIVGLLISFVAALIFSVEKGFPGTASSVIMAGPLTADEFDARSWSYPLGWLGLFLVWAHPIRPHPITRVATGLGLALWLFAGFNVNMRGAWGA